MDEKVEQLHSWGESLVVKFGQEGEAKCIDEAVVIGCEALILCPPGHLKRSVSLTRLAVHLYTRYNQLGSMENLNEAIDLDKEALVLRPPGHPDRWLSLNWLAQHLATRYDQLGSMEELNEAIDLVRDALELCSLGHPGRSQSLHMLAAHISARHEELGSVEDLDESIVLGQAALSLRPPGDPDRWRTLNNLGICFGNRYAQFGWMEDLNESIILHRDSLTFFSPRHPGRSTCLQNLATILYGRYKQLGSMEDLNEAIALNRDTLALCPPGHPVRSVSLGNLALHLHARYDNLGSVDDLNEAIVLHRDVQGLRPPGHPSRSLCSYNLANSLHARYQRFGSAEDLNEAIILDRDAVAFPLLKYPYYSSFLTRLADRLCIRHEQLGSVEDLHEAIVLDREALALRPPGHPERPESLSSLARHLSVRFTCCSQLPQDKEELFGLYVQLAHISPMAPSIDLPAVRSWIHVGRFPASHHILSLRDITSFSHSSYRRSSVSTSTFCCPEAPHVVTRSGCILSFSPQQSLTNAVELLEQGRGVFWALLTRLHSPIDDLIASGLEGKTVVGEFTHLTFLHRKVLDSSDQHQYGRMCDLNVQVEKVVTKIRSLPGLERFLLPALFSDLRQAACHGPVIIVNASKYGCDALIMLFDYHPVHVPLSITKEEVRELSSKLRMLTVRTQSTDVRRDLCLLLRELWDRVVLPVVDSLQMIHPARSRIWWCPTAEFCLLPLHAAGPFRKGQHNLPDLYILSYTPTLTTLIRARSHRPLSHASEAKRFVAIGQANAKGENELFSVSTELAQIGQHVDGEESSIDRGAQRG